MQDFVKMRGSDMIIFVPEELDHHGAEKSTPGGRSADGKPESQTGDLDFRETCLWTVPGSA